MVEIELSIANPGFRLFDGCPRRPLIGNALVNVFNLPPPPIPFPPAFP
jgi:hypothetical protein